TVSHSRHFHQPVYLSLGTPPPAQSDSPRLHPDDLPAHLVALHEAPSHKSRRVYATLILTKNILFAPLCLVGIVNVALCCRLFPMLLHLLLSTGKQVSQSNLPNC